MKICENCGKDHDSSYGSGRFCSMKCARGFSTKFNRDETNKKVSNTLKSKSQTQSIKICKMCNTEFTHGKKRQVYCSRKCAAKYKWENSEYKQFMASRNSIAAKRRHSENDTSFGWQTRYKLIPSYPEQIAIRVLDESGIDYIREFKFNKFFIDFVILKYKIAIEIDGKQHEKPDRAIMDLRKDEELIRDGWTIFRIKWPSDNIIDKLKQILASIPSD
jgi:very-short-patch-repair endonuclease